MALQLPPAVSISKFTGGYKANSNYTDLMDSETNDAANTVYGTTMDISQRNGSLRLYNYNLFSTSDTATGRPITGHYFFKKLGTTTSYHVACAGDSIYNYTSSTANAIRVGMTDNSNTFWNFIQVQDPRTPSDDLVMMTNGSNPIQVWTGSATAVALSSFTSATQVPVCNYLLNHKERIYAISIVDATDADASVRVYRTGFGVDGNADPHRFTENFYVGGSSKDGPIQNAGVLNDQIVFYKRNSIWKFNPSSGDVGDLYQLQDSIGLIAPYSLANCGDFHMFLSDRGVYAFDGNNLILVSDKIDNEFIINSNQSQLQYAKAVFDFQRSQYILYFPTTGSTRNDRAIVYDTRPSMKFWQPPITGRRVSYISTFLDSNSKRRVLYGDYRGFLFEDDTGSNDGLSTGFNGTVSSATINTMTDTTASFPTTGQGLSGMLLKIIDGTGVEQERTIASNTATTLTLESSFSAVPDTTSLYTIAAIDSYWRSKDYDFGAADITKLFRHISARVKEVGNITLNMHYIVNFKSLAAATLAQILQYVNGFAWGLGTWDSSRWGGVDVIRKKISLVSTASQSTSGTHLALRFSNRRANETFKMSGYDMEIKALGKR